MAVNNKALWEETSLCKEDELEAWKSAFKRYRRYGLTLTQELYNSAEGSFYSYVSNSEYWINRFRKECKLEEWECVLVLDNKDTMHPTSTHSIRSAEITGTINFEEVTP
jgi:hypothetical protein